MPRTRAQRRATQGPLGGLNDDALRRVLTFLSVSDSRSAGGASKALRAVATSNELARLRGSDSYLLRRSEHGVVHALATSFGTQPWRRVSFSFNVGTDQYHLARDVTNAAMPPSRLRIIAHRDVGDRALAVHLREDAVFPYQVVDPHPRLRLWQVELVDDGFLLDMFALDCPVAPLLIAQAVSRAHVSYRWREYDR